MATIFPNESFDPEASARELRAAMKGLGTNEEAIIQVIVNHDKRQRLEIESVYKTMFGRNLVDDLKSELGGNFEDAVIALMTPTYVYLARELVKAIKGAGTDESTLIEVLCTRSNEEIELLKEAYKDETGRELEDDIVGDTSGHFRRLLVSQCNAKREDYDVEQERAEDDAQRIYNGGQGQFGTDESAFYSVLCLRSIRQLRCTFEKYRDIAGCDIEEAITSETSGSLQDGLLAIVKYVRDYQLYYAERLYQSMKGAGTDDSTLIRIVTTRAEDDLKHVAMAFVDTYGQTLVDFIKADCGGDYRRLLIAVIG